MPVLPSPFPLRLHFLKLEPNKSFYQDEVLDFHLSIPSTDVRNDLCWLLYWTKVFFFSVKEENKQKVVMWGLIVEVSGCFKVSYRASSILTDVDQNHWQKFQSQADMILAVMVNSPC